MLDMPVPHDYNGIAQRTFTLLSLNKKYLECSLGVERFAAQSALVVFTHVLLLVSLQCNPVRILFPTEAALILKHSRNMIVYSIP